MGISDIERDLKFIRETMESSSRYTNVPAIGYLIAGILGLLGTWQTYRFLGWEKISLIKLITPADTRVLVMIWSLTFVTSIGGVAFFAWQKAKRHRLPAWNSLAARMSLSQIPVIIVAGTLTMAMAKEGYYDLIPGMWLGLYGTILYSFSYFTGIEHKVEGGVFILFGVMALFAHGTVAFTLLGVGFGGIHLISGLWRLVTEKKGTHVSE